MKYRQIGGIIALLLVGGWTVWATVEDVGEFFGENRGIAFYRDQPLLIGVCLAVGVVVGTALHWTLTVFESKRRKRRTNKGKGGVRDTRDRLRSA